MILTTVHHSNDTRIREKTARSLAASFDVVLAAGPPGPTDPGGLRFVPLRGGRWRRNLAAARLAFTTGFDILSLHDPETLPLGVAVSLLRRRPVVFDLHEDFPAQIGDKVWIHCWLRPVLAPLAAAALRLAEITLHITLAEPSYRSRFRRTHPVFANYPVPGRLPAPVAVADRYAVYVGDVTAARGLLEAVAACGLTGMPLVVVGRCSETMADRLQEAAVRSGTELTLAGQLPHPEAMTRLATAAVALSPLLDLPNYRHSVPTKVVEYLAMGVPVVASDLPATRQVIEGLAAVSLVAPGAIDEMAAAIAVAPAQKTAAMAQVETVRGRLQWPGEEVASFYRDLVRRRC